LSERPVTSSPVRIPLGPTISRRDSMILFMLVRVLSLKLVPVYRREWNREGF
jgi:hypothetical protein